jgi:hypothetical protein
MLGLEESAFAHSNRGHPSSCPGMHSRLRACTRRWSSFGLPSHKVFGPLPNLAVSGSTGETASPSPIPCFYATCEPQVWEDSGFLTTVCILRTEGVPTQYAELWGQMSGQLIARGAFASLGRLLHSLHRSFQVPFPKVFASRSPLLRLHAFYWNIRGQSCFGLNFLDTSRLQLCISKLIVP